MTFAINMCQFIIFTKVHKWVGIDYFTVKREKSWILAHGLDKLPKQSAGFSLAKWVIIFLDFLLSVSSWVFIFFYAGQQFAACKRCFTVRIQVENSLPKVQIGFSHQGRT